MIVLPEAFILHRYAYSESSMLLKILAPEVSLMPMIAKGIKGLKKTKSFKGSMASLCEPFNLLRLEYSGSGDVKSLKSCEQQRSISGFLDRLTGDRVICGLYINELLLTLLGPSVCSGYLFNHYVLCLTRLSQSQTNSQLLEPALRAFEKVLLQETGHCPDLIHDQDGNLILPDGLYELFPGESPIQIIKNKNQNQNKNNLYDGKVLLALTACEINQNYIFESKEIAKQAKYLLRQWIEFYTHGKILKTREIMRGRNYEVETT